MSFQDELNRWAAFAQGYQATESEVADLLASAAERENADQPQVVWNTLAKRLKDHTAMTDPDIATTVQTSQLLAYLGENPGANAERLTGLYCDHHKLHCLYDGQLVSEEFTMVVNGQVVRLSETDLADPDIAEQVALTRRDLNGLTLKRDLLLFSRRFSILKKITEGEIKAAVDGWISARRAERMSVLYRAISGNLSDADRAKAKAGVMATIDTAFANDALQTPEFVYAVLSKLVHSVKRKMLGLDVKWHLMPIFVGAKHGTGKTTLAQNVYSPIEEASRKLNFAQMADDRYKAEVSKALVVFVDELAGASKADFNAVKELITANTTDSRLLGFNDVVKHEMRASFIGTSNFALEETIKDPTGNRRFVGLNVKDSTWDFSIVQATPWADFWCSIDPYAIDPMMAHRETLEVTQASQRKATPIEEWIATFDPTTREWTDATGFAPFGKGWVSSTELHGVFRKWEMANISRNGVPTSNNKLTKHILDNQPSCPFKTRMKDGRRLFKYEPDAVASPVTDLADRKVA